MASARLAFQKLEDHSLFFWGLLGLHVVVVAIGLGAALYMEHNGHVVTGMNNQIVWGTPHVFAVFLIVAASGALNVASFSSVFGQLLYKPYSRLSGILAIALLAGGLAVLVLDLGRPDRLIVAMTKYNFKSIFAWNIYLYTGFMAIVGAYLFVMMDRRMSRNYVATQVVGSFAFVWRLALTTGTGSIFGFLMAREAYSAAIMAPLFIAASFLYGMAFTMLVLLTIGREARLNLIDDEMVRKFSTLMMVFALSVLYFTTVHHLTKLYAPSSRNVEMFLLTGANGGMVYAVTFWVGHVLIGNLLPFLLLLRFAISRRGGQPACWRALAIASVLALIGGVAHMYVIIIGAQAFPLELFPDMVVTSTFQDGQVADYIPSLPEVLLGVSGVSIAMLLTGVALKLLPFMPRQGA